MHIGGISGFVNPERLQKAQEILTWTTPSLVIPALRFVQDDPKDRKELFIRDFTSYAIGGCSYFAGTALGQLFFKTTKLVKNKPMVNFLSFLTGLAGYLLYSGIGAVQLSKKLSKKKKPKEQLKQAAQNIQTNVLTIKKKDLPETKPVSNFLDAYIKKAKATGLFDAFI